MSANPSPDWVPLLPKDISEGWQSRLLKGGKDNDKTMALLANAITALRHAPEWNGVLAFDQFSLNIVTQKPTPWGSAPRIGWSDLNDSLTADWLQHKGILVNANIAGQAVLAAAFDRPFHPVRDYLDGLQWDGIHRTGQWLNVYLGVQQSAYVEAVGRCWLRSGAARIYKPGCKADCALILEGPQGKFKSTAMHKLAGEFFTDDISELGTKDAAMQSAGKWIIEIAELDSMTRGEVTRVKAFMSRATDRFRPPYGRHVIEAPRQCVFVGTVNQDAWNPDETGGRRFWPVVCGDINIDALEEHRDQLWAEAKVEFEAGKPWWLDTRELNEAAEAEQAARYQGDSWDETRGGQAEYFGAGNQERRVSFRRCRFWARS